MKNVLLVITLLLSYLSSFAGVRYTTSNLNLRYEPGTNHEIITTIPAGTPVTIDEDCDCKWIAVEYNGEIGYVSSKYLSSYRPAPPRKRTIEEVTLPEDIILTLKVLECNLRHTIRECQPERQQYVEMGLIALVGAAEELAHIMEELQDGYNEKTQFMRYFTRENDLKFFRDPSLC